jgi:hypothetical protein
MITFYNFNTMSNNPKNSKTAITMNFLKKQSLHCHAGVLPAGKAEASQGWGVRFKGWIICSFSIRLFKKGIRLTCML